LLGVWVRIAEGARESDCFKSNGVVIRVALS
jgi:hypothetical protein